MPAREWGWWTSHKLEILQDYLQSFATASSRVSERIYLDLFAGRPENRDRITQEAILGSVHRALNVKPSFTRIGLFELPTRAAQLESAVAELRPAADVRVYPGDCNATLAKAMRDFHKVRWAPTFAFIDQQAAEVEWATIEQLAGFRYAKYPKAELWLLFGTSFLPRGLRIRQENLDEQFSSRVTALYGTPLWRPVVDAYRAGRCAPVQLRDELVNLMRYRLEHVLGYRWTHPFIMKNTRGQDLYCMIFATDHPAGDRIMANLYGTALDRHEQMRQDAALRVKFRKAEDENRRASQDALFPVEIKQVKAPEIRSDRVYVHQPAWRPGWLPDNIP